VVVNHRACYCVASERQHPRRSARQTRVLHVPIWPYIIKNSSFDARGRVESTVKMLRKINHERINVETPRRYVFSSLLWARRASVLLLMVLPFLRHKRVHDLLHRFSQIVRATGSHGRYCPRFHLRGRRYAVRKKDSFEVMFVKGSREKEINSIILEKYLIYFEKKIKQIKQILYSYLSCVTGSTSIVVVSMKDGSLCCKKSDSATTNENKSNTCVIYASLQNSLFRCCVLHREQVRIVYTSQFYIMPKTRG
jgi:hypothetical protein